MLARTDRPVTRPVVVVRPLARRLPARGYLVAGFVGWGLVLRRIIDSALG